MKINMNLNELIMESTRVGELKLAYTIFWAIQNKKVNGNDLFTDMMACELDHEAIERLQEQNILGIKTINLYTAKNNKGQFVYIFAISEIAAKMYYKTLYGVAARVMHDVSNRMDMVMWSENEGYHSFRQMKERTLEFPSVALVYEADNRPIEQVEHEYFQKFKRKLMSPEEKQFEIEQGDLLIY